MNFAFGSISKMFSIYKKLKFSYNYNLCCGDLQGVFTKGKKFFSNLKYQYYELRFPQDSYRCFLYMEIIKIMIIIIFFMTIQKLVMKGKIFS